MRTLAPILFTLCLAVAGPLAFAGSGRVDPIMVKQLADVPGKEAMMITVTYEPGGADEIHRHDAHVFVYVLEGSIVMQVKGQPAVTLNAGQSFYEAPDDIHVVGKNASSSERAKFLVMLIKKTNASPVIPVK